MVDSAAARLAVVGPADRGECKSVKVASEHFTDSEKSAIADAVTNAEKTTSGEIVPVVATSSGSYDRAEDIFGFMTALIALALFWFKYQEVAPDQSVWGNGSMVAMGLPMVLVVLVVGYIFGAALATRFPVIRKPFILELDMEKEVDRAAAEAFQTLRLRGTKDATGILLYISLYEQMARVLGDDTISAKLTDRDWEEVCKALVTGMSNGAPSNGLQDAISKSGKLLQQHFPIQPGDENELSNELRFID